MTLMSAPDANYIIQQLELSEKVFLDSKYGHLVERARACFESNMLIDVQACLSLLPTDYVLLKELVHKLRGKSVYKTLNRIVKGSDCTTVEQVKGYSSLMTHAMIEIEKGNNEYKLLVYMVYEKLGKLITTL